MDSPAPAAPQLSVPPSMAINPPMFGMQQGQKKPKAKSQTPTFLGSEMAANPTNTGQKTLLGM